MTSKAALFALLAMWGVGLGGALPARAEDLTSDEVATELAADSGAVSPGFADRVWVKAESGELPGVIRIFLSDGTLVQDSCWETHRLSSWTKTGNADLSWDEDGTRIKARIAALSATRMTLVLDLKDGPQTEHYVAAPVPSVCPDMPKA
ncbi:MAG: hypothetical protein P4M09_07590 [Devosia sp.]|nr:hypothetical protein [Devosia sp.]